MKEYEEVFATLDIPDPCADRGARRSTSAAGWRAGRLAGWWCSAQVAFAACDAAAAPPARLGRAFSLTPRPAPNPAQTSGATSGRRPASARRTRRAGGRSRRGGGGEAGRGWQEEQTSGRPELAG